jgi:hypothetical protein
MKRISLVLALAFAGSASAQTINPAQVRGTASVQTPTANQNTNQPPGTSYNVNTFNGTGFPGFGWASIQAAVNGTQSVEVPSTFAPGEMYYPGTEVTNSPIATSSFTKYTGAPVEDHRPLNNDVSLAQVISLPSIDGVSEGGDTAGAQRCVQAGHCVVAVVGNSIHENVAAVAPNDGYTQYLLDALQRKFPNTQFNIVNLSIGGTAAENFNDAGYICDPSSAANHFFRSTPGNWYMQQSFNSGFLAGAPYYQWPTGCNVGMNWKTHLSGINPDIVILGFVENEGSVGSAGFAASLTTAVTFVRSLKTIPPTVILTTDVPPNPLWGPTLGFQFPGIFEGLNEVVRGVAQSNGLLLADADRYYNVLAYGVDPGRRHFQVEHSFQNFPSQWAVALGGNSSDFPTISGSGLATTITYPTPSGSNGVVQRTRNAIDVVVSATFSGTHIGTSVPSIWYRMTPVALGGQQFGYKVQTTSATSGSNTIWSITLYYSNGIPQVPLFSGTCTVPTAIPLTLTIKTSGARHQVWCNTSTLIIDTYDYNLLSAGQVAIGVQGGPGSISNEYIYYGNPTQYFTPMTSIQSMLGTQVPPTYSATGDFDTNPFSFGGDGYHHPNAVGFDSYYLASFKPVLDSLEHAMTVNSIYSVTHKGSSGPFGGLQDSQDGHVDVVDGPTGVRIVNNSNSVVLESWDDGTSNPHLFNRPIAVNGGVPIGNTNDVPHVGASPTINRAACIKAAGPPVVIGFCSTVVDASGACTCN